jgi:hypothetical protein
MESQKTILSVLLQIKTPGPLSSHVSSATVQGAMRLRLTMPRHNVSHDIKA